MPTFELLNRISIAALTVIACAVASPEIAGASHSTTFYLAGQASDQGEEWYDRARRYYQQEHFAEAGRAYLRAAQLDYETGTAYYNAACSFALANQKDSAFDALNKSLDEGFVDLDQYADDDDLESLRSDARFQTFVARARNTDPSKARRTHALARFDRLQARNVKDEDSWRDVGLDLLRTGETTKATQAFRNAYAADSSASELYNVACAQSLGGQTAEALKTLERAILLGSGDPDQLEKDGDLRAVRRSPDYPRVLVLAKDLSLDNPWDRRKTSAWKTALPRYERVTKERPQIGRAWSNLGYVRLMAKNPQGSIEAYQRALSLGYQVPTTMYNLACAYAQSRNADEAIRWLENSERRGFHVGNYAFNDEDLDPLRSDPRFQSMIGRWHAAQRAENRAKHHDDDEDDEN